MQFLYNNLAMHDLGEVRVSQSREVEDGQRVRVTLRLAVDLFERTYGDNAALANQIREAFKTQEGTLQWRDDDANKDYVNQTVSLASHDLPEEWGAYYQSLNAVFFYYEQNLVTNNIALVFTPNPVAEPSGPNALTLDKAAKFKVTVTTERFVPTAGHRRTQRGKVTASGLLTTDSTQALADRRAALTLAKQKMDALNSVEGVLQFGDIFNETVRVEEFESEIDQLKYAIAWSFTATYTLFPDETDFATVDYDVEQRDTNTGEQFLTVSGRIVATDEATARTKLAELLPNVRTIYGYLPGKAGKPNVQELKNDTTAKLADANEDGTIFVELSFATEWRRWRITNVGMSFTKTGNGSSVGFGNVMGWDLEYNARRFNDQRSQRQYAGGRVSASGTFGADVGADLATRRQTLIDQANAMNTEVNGADGTLVYGSFNQVVRVESCLAKVNQAMTGVDWTLVAIYSKFPDESGYATAEYSVSQRSNAEDGEETMGFNGRIFAPDEALARAKLDAVRTAVLGLNGWAIAQRMRTEVAAQNVFANGDKTAGFSAHELTDGTTFIELTFQEEYRRRNGNLISWNLAINSRDDQSTGYVMTSYSGFVSASGTTVDAAYTTALAKAAALGANREGVIGGGAFLRSAQIIWEQRQTQATNAIEFVRLTFNYEYQGRMAAGRSYLEVNTDTTHESFGTDSTNVSGYVVAATAALATSIYTAQVRNGFTGANKMMLNERTVANVVKAEGGLAGAGNYNTQETRLEFGFTMYTPKGAGQYAYRYGMSVSSDYLTLEQSVHLRGSVFAASEVLARAALDGLISTVIASGSAVIRSERNTDYQYTKDISDNTGLFVKYDFDETYVTRLVGQSGLLEMRVSEEVQYSGVRWALQQVPRNTDGTGGVTIPQDAGEQEGGRVVRGTVTAPTRAAAEAWAKQQQAFLTGDTNSNHYVLPPKLDAELTFVPRVDGVATGVGANVQMYRVNFQFSEVLPLYRMT
jgi:hypothetical protein